MSLTLVMYINNNRVQGEDLAPIKCSIRLLSVLVVLFASHYLLGLCVGLCFVMHFFVSFLIVQSF